MQSRNLLKVSLDLAACLGQDSAQGKTEGRVRALLFRFQKVLAEGQRRAQARVPESFGFVLSLSNIKGQR